MRTQRTPSLCPCPQIYLCGLGLPSRAAVGAGGDGVRHALGGVCRVPEPVPAEGNTATARQKPRRLTGESAPRAPSCLMRPWPCMPGGCNWPGDQCLVGHRHVRYPRLCPPLSGARGFASTFGVRPPRQQPVVSRFDWHAILDWRSGFITGAGEAELGRFRTCTGTGATSYSFGVGTGRRHILGKSRTPRMPAPT